MNDDTIKVIYIGGHARSGSTLLHRILGMLPGAVAVGEVVAIDRVALRNPLCGCGLPFRACPFWTAVMDEAFGGFDGFDARRMMTLRRDLQRIRRLRRLLRRSRDRLSPAEIEFGEILGRMYAAIRRVSGASVIVDSSKDPAYGALLALVPGLEIRFVHLVRDSRATVYSEQQAKVVFESADKDAAPGQAYTRPPLRSAISWVISEIAWGAVGRRYGTQRLRYEDLVENPEAELGRLLPHLGWSGDESPIHDHSVDLPAVHTVIGNPNRFAVGPVVIKADRKWEEGLPSRSRLLVDLVTWPIMRARGYRIRLRRKATTSAGVSAKSE